ncbi:unnamed protein product [Rotaria socialis]|uniref:Uncharacterized protein n=3 Tax=Rotaria socialis TaxID=392032 RepID=A0A818SME1_9BILA|nr:unnamed protein product [Rotaria socialis]
MSFELSDTESDDPDEICLETANTNLETFYLIWLDPHVNTDKHHLEAQQRLRALISHLVTFDDVDTCRKYITQAPLKHYLVLIVSGQLGQKLVPRIHHINQVINIYVFCANKALHEKWAKEFQKVTAIFVSADDLISQIELDNKYRQKLAESLSFNTFNFNDVQAGQSTVGLNGQFVYNQVLMDVLLRIKYNKADKSELIKLCNTQYRKDPTELAIVKEFQHHYTSEKALWWYTRDCFLYKILNKALRMQDIHVLFLLRSFCLDLCQQLQEIQCQSKIKVYRGQLVSKSELTTLKNSLNQLISMNSFFSTSVSPQEASAFLYSKYTSTDLERVIFEIDANPNVVTTKPFADIRSQSAFVKESEVLFMFGSIFRLGSIEKTGDNIWRIRMTLCGENESGLKAVLQHMTNEYGNKKPNLHLLGMVLWKMGKFHLAEKYYQRMIRELQFNDPLIIDLYTDLSSIAAMRGSLDDSIHWKEKALEIKAHPAHNTTALPPRVLVAVSTAGSKKVASVASSTPTKSIYYEIEQRIAQVTDSKHMMFDPTQLHKCSREARMMAVAWIMVCKFDCKLYGGFVRDWIVGQYLERPNNITADNWILFNDSTAHLHPEIVPADLDCYLPTHGLYDIDEILNELAKLQMVVNVHRDQWRYLLLVDQNVKTGPFTIDLITPHIGINKYDRIDFDVNNLFVEKDCTKHLGMRVDITYPPYSITLEKIVDNIQKKRFYLLAGDDNKPCATVIEERMNKMITRGWKQIDETLPPVVPNPGPPSNIELTPVPKTSPVYQKIFEKMKLTFGGNDLKIISIEQIKNAELESIYEQAKKVIQKQTGLPDGNQMTLFHGAKGITISNEDNYSRIQLKPKYKRIKSLIEPGILKLKFTLNRQVKLFFVYNSGLPQRTLSFILGKGAYFSENPKLQHGRTFPDDDNERVMFQVKVLLGNAQSLSRHKINLNSVPENYHSVHGIFPQLPDSDEFIIYRYGQALPHLKITYRS